MNKYKEEKILGEGRFGSASLCTDLSSGNKVVVKTLSKEVNTKQLKSFEKEVAAMRLLDHPNIVRFIDSFEDDKNSYIVMEYADGGDLEQLIKSGPVDELVGVLIFYQLLLALDEIHRKKIVHKDIKPENILLDSEGNVKLADFGIAKILEYEGDMGTTIAYSQEYGAPELFKEGKYDTKYDIFSTGVVAYRMFTGFLPFDTQDQRTNGQFKLFPNTIDPFLKETIVRMLNTNPRRRPPTEKILSVVEKEYGEIRKGMDWKVKGKKLVIFGLGPIPNYSDKAPWEEKRDSIQSIIVKRGVKEIGDFAFCNLPKLTAVELHSDLKRIGGGVFMNCTQLKTIAIPNSVKYIGASAFKSCSILRTVQLPKELKEIRNWTFYDCISLQTIYMERVDSIGNSAFQGTQIDMQCTTYTKENVNFLEKMEELSTDKDKLKIRQRKFELFEREAELGSIEAISKLAICYDKGRGTKRNKELCAFYRKMVENSTDPSSLNKMYLNIPSEDEAVKINCFKILSALGSPNASYLAGRCLKRKGDDKGTFEHFQKASDGGLFCATYELGLCYKEGRGTERNNEEAIVLLKRASDGGYKRASYSLGVIYEKGRVVEQNFEEAVRLYRLGYEQGDIDAIQRLARCYDKGLGVEQNKEEGKRWRIEISRIVLNESKGLQWVRDGEIIWGFNKGCSRLIIGGIGPLKDYVEGRKICRMKDYDQDGNGEPPWNKKYRGNITSVIVLYGVSNIGGRAFRCCINLKRVKLPDTIKRIGSCAFEWCGKLKSILISNSLTSIGGSAFGGCTALHSFAFPDSVTSIGGKAFYECESLTSIIIPESVTYIGVRAFDRCFSLRSVTIPDSNITIDRRAFSICPRLKTVFIPEGLEYPSDAFPSGSTINKY